MFDIKGKWLLG